MRRRNFYLTEDQNKTLESMKGLTVSEHIRRAIDQYIENHRVKSISSPSKNK